MVPSSLSYIFMVSRELLYLRTSSPRPEEEEGGDQWFSLSQALVEKGGLSKELVFGFRLQNWLQEVLDIKVEKRV